MRAGEAGVAVPLPRPPLTLLTRDEVRAAVPGPGPGRAGRVPGLPGATAMEAGLGAGLSLVLLHPGPAGLPALERRLAGRGGWAALLASLRPANLTITAPPMQVSSALNLGPALSALGLSSALNSTQPDLAAISSGLRDQTKKSIEIWPNLKGSLVLYFEVSRVGPGVTGFMQSNSFRLDPGPGEGREVGLSTEFLYLVRHDATGLLVTIGRQPAIQAS